MLLIEPLLSLSLFHVDRNARPGAKKTIQHWGILALHFVLPLGLALVIYVRLLLLV